eukprot:356968-Chlamydomonas_euryale.AAC.2
MGAWLTGSRGTPRRFCSRPAHVSLVEGAARLQTEHLRPACSRCSSSIAIQHVPAFPDLAFVPVMRESRHPFKREDHKSSAQPVHTTATVLCGVPSG